MKTSQKAIRVTDIQSLKREKNRLKRLCKEMEQEGHDRLDHVKKHYGSMALNSIFPEANPETQFWKLVAQGAKSAWGSTHFRSILIRALITFLEFFGVQQGIKLFEKYFGKKDKTKAAEDETATE